MKDKLGNDKNIYILLFLLVFTNIFTTILYGSNVSWNMVKYTYSWNMYEPASEVKEVIEIVNSVNKAKSVLWYTNVTIVVLIVLSILRKAYKKRTEEKSIQV